MRGESCQPPKPTPKKTGWRRCGIRQRAKARLRWRDFPECLQITFEGRAKLGWLKTLKNCASTRSFTCSSTGTT